MKEVLQLCNKILSDPEASDEQKKQVRKFAIDMILMMQDTLRQGGTCWYTLLK